MKKKATRTKEPSLLKAPKGKKDTSSGKKIDILTLMLAFTALILLVLVILLLNQRLFFFLFPQKSQEVAAQGGTPQVIQAAPPKEAPPPLPDPQLEKPPQETTQIEVIPDISGPDPREAEVTAKTRIFLVKVDNDQGQISLKGVIRGIPQSTSPLTQTLRSLLDGPQSGELNKGYLSLIPDDVKILNVRVDNEIAWIDFNEAFRFNSLGMEGYSAQVKQVVFTATEFPTVNRVQILIEGQMVDYLGAEGFWIGEPLGRENF